MINDKIINFISAVVYVYNDEKIIGGFIESIHKVLSEHFMNYEMILIDDGSVDNSAEEIRSAAEKTRCNSITLVKLNNHQGYEPAMNAGVDLSNGDYVIEFDSPVLDFDPKLIMDVYAKSQEGYDIVSASNTLYKKSSSDFFYSVFNRGANLKYDVQSESFRLVSRRAINKICSMSNTIIYRKAFYANCGLRYFNIKYEGKRELLKCRSSNREQRSDLAATSLILFTNISYKVALGISFFMMFMTVFMAIYAIVVFTTYGAVEGFTTTMLVISGSFFAVFLLFAIVIKYLSVISQMIFSKQNYRIESIERLSGSSKEN